MAGFQSRSHSIGALIFGANFGILLTKSYLVHLRDYSLSRVSVKSGKDQLWHLN